MRIAILAMVLAAATLCAGEVAAAAAKKHPRPRAHAAARHHPRVAKAPARPAHGMSALARAAQREKAGAAFQVAEDDPSAVARFRAGQADGRLGAFKRNYKLDVYRPTVRPDEDGTVGLTLKLKRP